MRDKIILILLSILLLAVLIFSIDSRIQSNRDSKRAAELERRAIKFEKLYTETDKLYSEALGIIERTGSELAGIREANSRLREIESDLRAENRILERTINELRDLGSEFAEGTGRAEELIQAIDAEARRALEWLDRIQAGSREAD